MSFRGNVPPPENVYAIYVEKEMVGKRIKKSKVKIAWQFALPDLTIHAVELKHSLVSGKREISRDGQLEYHNRKVFSGKFEYPLYIDNHQLKVTIEERYDGYNYGLLIDGAEFHRLERKSAQAIHEMKQERASGVKSMEYNSFVSGGKDGASKSENTDGKSKKKKKNKDKVKKAEPEQADMLGLFDSPNPAPAQPANAAPGWADGFAGQSLAFDPFATSNPAPAPQPVPAQQPQGHVPNQGQAGHAPAFNPFGDGLSGQQQSSLAPPQSGFNGQEQAPQAPLAAGQPVEALTGTLAELDFSTSIARPSEEELAAAKEEEDSSEAASTTEPGSALLGGAVESGLVNLDDMFGSSKPGYAAPKPSAPAPNPFSQPQVRQPSFSMQSNMPGMAAPRPQQQQALGMQGNMVNGATNAMYGMPPQQQQPLGMGMMHPQMQQQQQMMMMQQQQRQQMQPQANMYAAQMNNATPAHNPFG